MNEWVVTNEAWVRSLCFFSILVVMMIWEGVKPKRQRLHTRLLRWTNNLGLVFFNSLVVRLILPLATVGVAQFAQQHEWGLFNQIQLHPIWVVVLTVVLFDMAIYWQHRLFHVVPVLWRLHKMHHVDQDIDVTTGSRFHPVEIILSLLIKFALVLLLGPSLLAVMLFEIILNGTAMFNHANVALPKKLDGVLRPWLVTPDMHRVHHSTILRESNSNYGFNLSVWDRLFGSYIAQPSLGHDGMHIGVRGYNNPKQIQILPGMLYLPFARVLPDQEVDNLGPNEGNGTKR
ncbi:sterol desaturase family protein [Oceaniserpentilla sp. 4NH20-0058]|uniref:sterol desaturase family protein n=1 Tax=Oceaniserpentilla sp. 4NH20-0058 TaxID=3127660 RepID=UPI003108C72E